MIQFGFSRIFPTVFFVALFTFSIVAQNDQCELAIDRTVNQMSSVCKDIASESVCYGHRHLELVLDSAQEVTFNTPGDYVSFDVVDTIQSFAINPATLDYGTAIINTQGMTLFAVGGVEFRQAVPQSYFFLGDFAAAECGNAPSALVAYTATPTSLTLNNSSIIINGVVIFQQQSANSITASVQRGTLQITEGEQALQGQTLSAVVKNDGSVLYWSAARPTNGEELGAAGTIVRLLESLDFVVGCQFSYTVAAGDTLGIIAQQYNTTVEEIAAANGIVDINIISVDQVINIPCDDLAANNDNVPLDAPVAQTPCEGQIIHIVAGGENMYRIAQRYNTTIEAISAANGITNPRLLSVGQQLVIPCGVDYGPEGALPSSANPLLPSESLQTVCADLAATSMPEGFESFGMGAAYFYNLVCQP